MEIIHLLPERKRRESKEKVEKVSFSHKIKFIKRNTGSTVIVTEYNDIYLHDDTSDIINFDKLKHNFNKIKFIECSEEGIFIVNEKNEFYFMGKFGSLCEKVFHNKSKFTNVTELINNKEEIKFIKSSGSHLFIYTDNNILYGFGDNDYGQLGLPCEDFIKNLTKILTLNIKDLQCSSEHSIILDYNGNIYGAGNNECGELGILDKSQIEEFTKIDFPYKVKKISCNLGFTLILTTYNELFGCGCNYCGELGLPVCDEVLTFTKINISLENNDKINNLYNGNKFNMIVTENNLIYITGLDDFEVFNVDHKFHELNYIDKFTEIKFDGTVKRKYIFPILGDNDKFIINSNFKINDEDNEQVIKVVDRLNNCQLIDLNIYFKQDKKRKRIKDLDNDTSFN
ncbi:hypothetical protein ABK040_008443 [Willaertia magna]